MATTTRSGIRPPATYDDATEITNRLARDLAGGTIDLDQAATAVVAHATWSDTRSTARRVVDAAERHAVNDALAALRNRLDPDTLDTDLRQAAADTLTAIHDLRPLLADLPKVDRKGQPVDPARAAVAIGPDEAAAWATYANQLLPRWRTIHTLARSLRDVHWLPPLRDDARPEESEYARPDLRLEDRRGNSLGGRRAPAPHDLLDPVSDRWGPGGPYGPDEIARHRRAADNDADPTAELRSTEPVR